MTDLKLPKLAEIHKASIGWFPIKASNPSKLTAHKFVNGKWVRLSYVMYVPWKAWGSENCDPIEALPVIYLEEKELDKS